MNAQDVANSLWALSELGWYCRTAQAVPAVAALHAAAQRCASVMNPQGVSNTLLALARLGHAVDGALQDALLRAVERHAAGPGGMNEQDVANTPLGALGAGLVSLGRASRACRGRLARSRAAARRRHEPAGRVKHAAGARQARNPVDDALQAALLLAIKRAHCSCGWGRKLHSMWPTRCGRCRS